MNSIVVVTTTETEEQSMKLAEAAVDRHLAACVQVIGPLRSVYRWEGKVCDAAEFRCEMKTSAESFSTLQQLILELHPYEVPEIIALPISQALPEYADWMDAQLQRP